MATIDQPQELPLDTKEYPSDVITIKKSWLTMAAAVLASSIISGLIGFMLGVFAFSQGQASANNGILEAAQGQSGAQAAQPAAQAQQPAAPVAVLDFVNIDDDPFLGSANAPVVIVEFSDFQCPFCSRFHTDTFQPLLDQYGNDIQFVYRDFPIASIHPQAQEAAEASECADEQGAYWEYHDKLFTNQTALASSDLLTYASELELDVDAFTECLETGRFRDEVLDDMNEGRSYGVTGTPTFFINGVRLVGAQPLEAFQSIIDEELAK